MSDVKITTHLLICLGNAGWNGLTTEDWVNLLVEAPDVFLSFYYVDEIATKCDEFDQWRNFKGVDWARILTRHPRLAGKCEKIDGWKDFDGYDWGSLLAEQPQFEKQCNQYDGWKNFSNHEWVLLLRAQPHLVVKFEELQGWEDFAWEDYNCWEYILSAQPQLANYCDKHDGWSSFCGSDWQRLLAAQPQLAKYCDENDGWSCLGGANWLALLVSHPIFIRRNLHFVYEKFTSRQWCILLKNRPELADICDSTIWTQFDGFDWIELLRMQPQFSDKCDVFDGWRKIDFGKGISIQEIKEQLDAGARTIKSKTSTHTHGMCDEQCGIPYCGRWAELLCIQPQFATKCEEYRGWDVFNGFDWWLLLRYEPLFLAKCNAHHGWDKIFSYKPEKPAGINDYSFYYKPEIAPCQYMKRFGYPFEYKETYSINDNLPSLILHENITESDRHKKPYYQTIPTTLSYGTLKYGSNHKEYWQAGLPIDLYADLFWEYNQELLQEIDTSYWVYILYQHLNDDYLFNEDAQCLGNITNSLFALFDNKNIWYRFSREKWEFVFSVEYCGATKINRIAAFSSLHFWNALLTAWPDCISDANHIADKSYNDERHFSGWAYLLRLRPDLVHLCEECQGWCLLDKNSWGALLDSKWHFLDNVASQELSASFWVEMLRQLPRNFSLCDRYKGWKLFDKKDWIDLVAEHEQFVDKLMTMNLLESFGWKSKNEVIKEARHHRYLAAIDGYYDCDNEQAPDWREESGWNDEYGDADPTDFIEFR